MKSSIFTFVLAAGLSGQAFAQGTPAGTEHDAHHPQAAQERTAAPMGSVMAQSGSTPAPNMQMPMGGAASQGGQRPGGMMSGMAQGMMSCPMMQGGMAGMRQGGMQMGQPRGDQSVGSLAMNAVNERMHREMMMEYTGNVDVDFARNMVNHHQGAIDMAKIVAAFGKDPKMRELAQNIIKAQESEITVMRAWLAENAKQ
jgi:uncharacterized protein (DUF305 family)